jgi:hypothetical protein
MKKLLFFFFISLLLSNCKTNKPTRPVEIYKTAEALPASTIRLPLSISLDDLEKTINDQIDKLFIDGAVLPEDYGNGLKVKVTKNGTIRLAAKGRSVTFDVPLDLKLEKNVGFTDLKADGAITLSLQTNYKIDQDWNIKTETSVTNYKWTNKPILDIGIIKVPLEGMANQLIDRSKETLTREIDKQLQERFALKEYAQLAVDTLQKPFLVSEEYDAWLSVRPSRIIMAPLETNQRKVSTAILLEAKTDITVDKTNMNITSFEKLPTLEEQEVEGEGFQFYFQTKVPYHLIEAEAKKQLLGEVFEDGKRKVKVEDIKVYGQNDQLVVNAKLSGDYDGSIYLLGKPVYNKDKGQLELADFDFELKTRQFLKKSMAWLLQRNLKKQLQENLNYPVKKELEESKMAIQEQMKNLVQHPQLEVTGTVADLTIKQLFVEKEQVVVALYASGEVKVEIKDLFIKE